jgi:hypothetical protein
MSMNPERRLVLGLGNPIAGDDGIGSHIARDSAITPASPGSDVMEGGTDLLRLAPQLEQRRPVSSWWTPSWTRENPGSCSASRATFDELDERGGSVHHLSPRAGAPAPALPLPALREVPTTFLAVTIA